MSCWSRPYNMNHHRYTYVHSILNLPLCLPHSNPLSHHRAPGWAPYVLQQLPTEIFLFGVRKENDCLFHCFNFHFYIFNTPFKMPAGTCGKGGPSLEYFCRGYETLKSQDGSPAPSSAVWCLSLSLFSEELLSTPSFALSQPHVKQKSWSPPFLHSYFQLFSHTFLLRTIFEEFLCATLEKKKSGFFSLVSKTCH